ncbi:MAG: tricarboxylate transporter, partial [Ruegeria sp.]
STVAGSPILLAATWVFVYILARIPFRAAFFGIGAGPGWGRPLILTACGIGFMCFMAGALNRDFPPGLLQEMVNLPWPLK